MKLPPGQFSIIYADPPWSFKTWSDKGKGRSPKYKVMTRAQIASMPIQEIAAPDCCCFMWATYPMLPHAIMTLEAWGFDYKTVAFTWIKTTRKWGFLYWYADLLRGAGRYLGLHTGMGYWTRSNAEICLLGTRGKPKRVSASVHSVIISPVREHSRKPDEASTRIVQLLGDLPRIELFARQYTPGWQVWGDEIE